MAQWLFESDERYVANWFWETVELHMENMISDLELLIDEFRESYQKLPLETI